MRVETAQWILSVVAAYLGIGIAFAAAFLHAGAGRVDPAAAAGSRGFRWVISPGVVALWPFLAIRWHRVRARRVR